MKKDNRSNVLMIYIMYMCIYMDCIMEYVNAMPLHQECYFVCVGRLPSMQKLFHRFISLKLRRKSSTIQWQHNERRSQCFAIEIEHRIEVHFQ